MCDFNVSVEPSTCETEMWQFCVMSNPTTLIKSCIYGTTAQKLRVNPNVHDSGISLMWHTYICLFPCPDFVKNMYFRRWLCFCHRQNTKILKPTINAIWTSYVAHIYAVSVVAHMGQKHYRKFFTTEVSEKSHTQSQKWKWITLSHLRISKVPKRGTTFSTQVYKKSTNTRCLLF